MYTLLARKFFLPMLLFLLLPAAGAFAQIGAIDPSYSDTTKYWPLRISPTDTTYRPLSRRQDSIFVFFNRHGKLTATQPQGRTARFTWQKLDTASLTFQTIWVDTVNVQPYKTDFFTQVERDSSRCDSFPQQVLYTADRNTSALPDSVGFGCYRVVTDTLQTLYDTVHCDAFYMVSKAADGTDSAATYIPANILIAKGAQAVAADTFTAWVFVDSFRIDSIATNSHDCNFLNLQAYFYPASEGYYSYSYIDLWRTPRKEIRDYPDCHDCYIKSVEWITIPDDIHKGADISDEGTWKRSYIAYIPTPLHDAKYKVIVENYFGARDTLETDTIEAKSTYAQMKMFVEKPDKNGVKGWEEKTSMEETEKSPLSVYLANTSINAGNSSTFSWTLFANSYEQEDTLTMPPPLWQTTTTDSAEAVYPPEPYRPGKYPITLLVVNRHGCTDSDTLTLEVEEYLIEPDAVPPLFTPNGDGKNDVYQLKDPDSKVHSVEAIEVSIFNRYGQLVFHSRDVFFAWNGKLRGTNSLAPDGVYFYVIKAQGYSKQRKRIRETLKGSIHLLGGKQ
jgi:gliding motility-associated-like protein